MSNGTMMATESEIYEKIARSMTSAPPSDAMEVIFEGKVYDAFDQMGICWIAPDRRRVTFPFGRRPIEIEEALRGHVMELLKLVAKAGAAPWTHFRVVLSRKGQFRMEFAYIPEDDDWVGVYMRRVSDLTAEEAAAAYIPEKDWLERVRRRAEQEGKATS